MERSMGRADRRRRAVRTTAVLASCVVGVAALGGCGGSSGGDTSSTGAGGGATASTVPVDDEIAGTATDFSAPGVAVIAHRGASAYAPEHTFAAYDLAVEQGADYIEQDLQLTKDGQLVVLHDPTLDRTVRGPAAQCSGAVADKTLEDLSACEAGSSFNEANPDQADPDFATLTIPTMRQVFDRYLSDARYYIEVKSPEEQPGVEEALLELLDEVDIDASASADPTLPPIVIQSFSADSLKRIHGLRPELPLVQLIAASDPVPDEAALDEISTYAVALGPPKTTVDAALVARANDRCLDVHPYTVKPEEMAALLDAGVGAMFTNEPDALVEARKAAPERPDLCLAPATAED